MLVTCLAVIGTMCISTSSNLTAFSVSRSSPELAGGVEVEGDGWSVSQAIHSDCVNCGPDRKLLATACEESVCISYYRKCDDPNHPTMCEYYFDGYQPIVVMAKSEDYYRGIIECIGIDAAKGGILLSALTQEAPGPRKGPPMENYLRRPKSQGDGQ